VSLIPKKWNHCENLLHNPFEIARADLTFIEPFKASTRDTTEGLDFAGLRKASI